MQAIFIPTPTGPAECILPGEMECVLEGVKWGSAEETLTPAYWAMRYRLHDAYGDYRHFQLGRSLAEELAACLLGGYGMPAEVGLAAFGRLRDEGLLEGCPSAEVIEGRLSEPLLVNGRSIRYRFPRQKAAYLAAALKLISTSVLPASDRALRNLLMEAPGVGPKTASWVVRNHRGSDHVAIIDIHLLRAGVAAGFFEPHWRPERHYLRLESRFLEFAAAIGARASILDNLIWQHMRQLSMLMRPNQFSAAA